MSKLGDHPADLNGRLLKKLRRPWIHISLSENRTLNSTRSQSILQNSPEQASFQCVGTNVGIGNGVGINHASNYQRRTTNRVAIVGPALDKIGNRSFGRAAHTLQAAF